MAQINLYSGEQIQIGRSPIMLQSVANSTANIYISVDGVEFKPLTNTSGANVTLSPVNTKVIAGLPEGCYIQIQNITPSSDYVKILY